MKNISFDNPYLLLVAIPVALAVIIPFFLVRNKDNKNALWTISLCVHIVIILLVALAIAGLASVSVLTKTTVYVVADVSYSSDKNLDQIDEYIEKIKKSLPDKYSLGVVCFGKNCVVLTEAGRALKSVSEVSLDNSATDIVGALNFTETLFDGDSLKRIVLITDGNDTISKSSGSIASTVERLTENGVKIDAIFLDNSIKENETEIQLLEVEHLKSTYLKHENEAKFLIQSSTRADVMLELYARKTAKDGETPSEYEKISATAITAEAGLNTVRVSLPSNEADTFEYKVVVSSEKDISRYNNERTFSQTVVGEQKILHITGSANDKSIIESIYGSSSEIDAYIVGGGNNRVPITLEELVQYDQILISNLDIREIRNVNAFVDTLEIVISKYGKSLITFGDLKIQTDRDDKILSKLEELLPVSYGSTNVDGKLYTIVLDISNSMFMASKFTVAKNAASRLISVMNDEDYVCLVTFSGDVHIRTPKKVRECKDDLIEFIQTCEIGAGGTDIGLGLEEALKAVKALNLSENQIMIISDGFSFENEIDAVDVAKELYDRGATVSAVNTYIPSEGTNGRTTLRGIVSAGEGGNYYEISRPEDVERVVFGTIAPDVGQAIVEKDAVANIAKHKDPIASGFASLPNVSRYILSMKKYDAKLPLTITYQKNNGYQETIPFYAYRQHGNGQVSSLVCGLSEEWLAHWSDAEKATLVSNMFSANAPKERNDQPFTTKLEKTEYNAYIEIVPSILDTMAEAEAKITYPNGRVSTKKLIFDSNKYFYSFDTTTTGTYILDLTYTYDGKCFTTREAFEVAYLPEYNAFAPFDKFTVYEFMRGNGSVCVDEIPSLENSEDDVTTYKVSYVILLLAISAGLFVFDVFIRKLRFKKNKTVKDNRKEKTDSNV